MEDKILNDTTPSLETVRTWAYRSDMFLIEQDEDLILHDVRYLPLLVELADDPACPKRRYILSILYYYTQLSLLHRQAPVVLAIRKAIQTQAEHLQDVSELIHAIDHMTLRLLEPKPLDESEAHSLAHDLLVGKYSSRQFEDTKRLVAEHKEYKCWTDSFLAYLYINPLTGTWRYSQYRQMNDIKDNS